MEKFAVTLDNGRTLYGAAYKIPDPRMHLVVHTGMQEKATRYEEFANFLNQNGIDVYVLDAHGQGFNAVDEDHLQIWPKGGFFDSVNALHQKIEELKKDGLPTCLMGHSMGSFIVQHYLEVYPNTADKVIIMGSNGPAKLLMGMGYFLASLTVNKRNWNEPSKFITNLSLGAYTKSVKDRKTDVDWLSYNEENVEAYLADPYLGHTNTKGFWKEFLKGMTLIHKKKYLKNISKDEHVLIVAGDADPVGNMGKGPRELGELYKSLGMKDCTVKIYDHMRHEILNEDKKTDVMNDILEFLNK